MTDNLRAHLEAWAAPEPSAAETDWLIQRLLPLVPSPSPVRQAVGAGGRTPWQELCWLVGLARLQVTVVRPAFWLSSAAILLLGVLAVIVRPSAERSFVLYVTGPLLGYLGTASAFRSVGLGLLECELGCPPSARQLTVARLTVVLGYLLGLGLLASALLGGGASDGFWRMSLHWLGPLVLGVGLTLVLSLRRAVPIAAGFVYAAWLGMLAVLWQVGTGDPPAVLAPAIEVLLAGLGVVLLGSAIRALPAALFPAGPAR